MGAGQTKVDLGSQSKNVDFSQAASVRPFPTGTVLPTTCSVGQMYFLTGSGTSVYECAATNTWTPIKGSTANAIFDVQRTSGTVLTIGSQCSISTPCVFRIGSVVYSVTAPATATLTNGSGVAYIYIDNNGNILVGVSSSNATCTGCQVVAAVTQFPPGVIPISSWNATNGAWNPTGSNQVALLSIQPALNAGSNITIAQTGQGFTISSTGGGSSSGPPTPATSFDPTDPTQFFLNHLAMNTGFSQGRDGWDYSGSCGVGQGVGAVGFSMESVTAAVWGQVTGISPCFFYFPADHNTNAYGGGTFDYFSGSTPASLFVSATYTAADVNGTQYVGLASSGSSEANFVGCRQSGAGNWFAVIRAGGADVATADTGVPHDNLTHRLTVDNNSGMPGQIRCSVDGGTPASAAGVVPVETFGWYYVVGAKGNGSPATTFALTQYVIFLQSLPRQ